MKIPFAGDLAAIAGTRNSNTFLVHFGAGALSLQTSGCFCFVSQGGCGECAAHVARSCQEAQYKNRWVGFKGRWMGSLSTKFVEVVVPS